MAEGVSATYRGYRRQALYVLWRLLSDPEAHRRAFKPEGEEDLAVFDEFGRLVEAVQVKDLSSPVKLSDLKPSSPDGYVARATKRLGEHPDCRHCLAIYGQLGPELRAAIEGNPSARDGQKRRLAAKSNPRPVGDIDAVLDALRGNVVAVEEHLLTTEITRHLVGSVAGLHIPVTVDLLLYWIYESSERQRVITRAMFLQQVERIGEYLAGLRDHSSEWMTTIRPLEPHHILPVDAERLRDSYRRGANATWEHIVAGGDSVRSGRLQELRAKLNSHDVVVIRGASGQGKSSLAFRYLHDFHPSGTRFLVRFVEGRAHADRIATALRAHVLGMRIPAVALLDLSPADRGWMVLLPALAAAGIKVVVAVREEDAARAGRFPPDVSVGEVSLDGVTREEAGQIYASLAGVEATTLDFHQAWAQFDAREAAPLLEFTHLVTQGRSLATTVEEQVRRLQAEATGGGTSGISERHLHLLAMAAVVNSAEARIDLEGALEAARLDPMTRPLAVLEREFLLKQDAAPRPALAGLHALRSQAVVSSLFHDCPDRWASVALGALPLIPDTDVERFLLFAFSRYPEHSAALADGLRSVRPRSWTHAASITRALLWAGISRYELENRDTIASARAQYQEGWWMLCDVNLESDVGPHREMRRILAETLNCEIPTIPMSDKGTVLSPLRAWAATATPPNGPPSTRQELVDLADTAFWLRRADVHGGLRNALEAVSAPELPDDMSAAELAQVVSGLYVADDEVFADWHHRHYPLLVRRFVEDTISIGVVDDGNAAKVLFPVLLPAVSGDGAEDPDLHGQAIRRVAQLRHLLPMRAHVGSQGVGIEALMGLLPNDPTDKLIKRDLLPLSRSVEVNSTFLNLVSYRLERADSWGAYAAAALDFRRDASNMLRGLTRAWSRLVERQHVLATDIRPLAEIGLSKVKDARLPMFPRAAVDEWGCVSEARDNQPSSTSVAAVLLWNDLRRLAEWRREWQEYVSCVQRIASTVFDATVKHIASKNARFERKEELKAERLAIFNIQGAWRTLPAMQTSFRRWFGTYVDPPTLAALERNERSVYDHLWPTAFAFISNPDRAVRGGVGRIAAELGDRRRRFTTAVATEAKSAMDGAGCVRIVEGPVLAGGKQCLGVVCDHKSAVTVEAAKSRIVLALRRAARPKEWEPFESVDLCMQWPHTFVCHTVRGRAVLSAGAFISTTALTEGGEFSVAGHHLADLPVPRDVFEALSVPVWDLPLVSAAVDLHSHLARFVFAMMQGGAIIHEVRRLDLSNMDPATTSLRATARAITDERQRTLVAHMELDALLQCREGSERDPSACALVRTEVQRIVEAVTFGDRAGVLTIDADEFEAWIGLVSAGLPLNAAIAGVIDLAVGAPGPGASSDRPVA